MELHLQGWRNPSHDLDKNKPRGLNPQNNGKGSHNPVVPLGGSLNHIYTSFLHLVKTWGQKERLRPLDHSKTLVTSLNA